MKKALKIFGGVVAALVGLMLVSPILLKDKAKDIALETINGMLNAEVYLDDVSISFFKNFPNASVTAEKFGYTVLDFVFSHDKSSFSQGKDTI